MLQLEPGQFYTMPVNFGPAGTGSTIYHEVETVTVAWRTERKALLALLPPVFELPEAILVLSYRVNRQVDWAAGRPYNLVALNVPVVFRGADGPIEGYYALVVWEDFTDAIISGREQSGVPKIAAEIQTLRQVDGRWFGAMSLNGHTFFELNFRASDEVEASASPGRLAEAGATERLNWFGWRYIPQVNGAGGSINEFVNFPQDTQTLSTRTGVARLRWTVLGPSRAPTQAHIIAAIAALPLGDQLFAEVTTARTTLRGDLAVVLTPASS